MTTKYKPGSIDELVTAIYEDNFSHVDFMDNMGGDCDCAIHLTLQTILRYWEQGRKALFFFGNRTNQTFSIFI